jgi:hypothetical protein
LVCCRAVAIAQLAGRGGPGSGRSQPGDDVDDLLGWSGKGDDGVDTEVIEGSAASTPAPLGVVDTDDPDASVVELEDLCRGDEREGVVDDDDIDVVEGIAGLVERDETEGADVVGDEELEGLAPRLRCGDETDDEPFSHHPLPR